MQKGQTLKPSRYQSILTLNNHESIQDKKTCPKADPYNSAPSEPLPLECLKGFFKSVLSTQGQIVAQGL